MPTRRVSVLDQASALMAAVRDRQQQLVDIWDEVGFPEAEREERTATVFGHLQSLLDEMLNQEDEMRTELRQQATTVEAEVRRLARVLGVGDELDFPPALLSRIRCLKVRLEELEALKSASLRRLAQLQNRDAELAADLDLPICQLEIAEVPSQQDLEKLERHLTEREEELSRRQERMTTGRVQVAAVRRRIPAEAAIAEKELERALASGSKLSLSEANLVGVESLVEALESELAEWRERMAAALDVAVRELEAAWEQCLVPAEDRMALPEPESGIYGQQDVDAVVEETARWMAFYAARKEVLAKAADWNRLWEEKMAAERPKDGDTKRYNNRGGQLEKALKRQRQVEAMLPRVETELGEMMAKWRREHPDETVTLDGFDPLEHIRRTKGEYEETKAAEKAERESRKRAGADMTVRNNSRVGVKRNHPTIPQAANNAHHIPGTATRTPVKTQHDLYVTAANSPYNLGVSKSASKIATPARDGFLEPRTPKLRKIDHGASTSRIATPVLGATGRALRSATSVANLPSHPLLEDPVVAGSGHKPAKNRSLEETIDENAFRGGDFANSTLSRPGH